MLRAFTDGLKMLAQLAPRVREPHIDDEVVDQVDAITRWRASVTLVPRRSEFGISAISST